MTNVTDVTLEAKTNEIKAKTPLFDMFLLNLSSQKIKSVTPQNVTERDRRDRFYKYYSFSKLKP